MTTTKQAALRLVIVYRNQTSSADTHKVQVDSQKEKLPSTQLFTFQCFKLINSFPTVSIGHRWPTNNGLNAIFETISVTDTLRHLTYSRSIEGELRVRFFPLGCDFWAGFEYMCTLVRVKSENNRLLKQRVRSEASQILQFYCVCGWY